MVKSKYYEKDVFYCFCGIIRDFCLGAGVADADDNHDDIDRGRWRR